MKTMYLVHAVTVNGFETKVISYAFSRVEFANRRALGLYASLHPEEKDREYGYPEEGFFVGRIGNNCKIAVSPITVDE
jgi:hypothetical protein